MSHSSVSSLDSLFWFVFSDVWGCSGLSTWNIACKRLGFHSNPIYLNQRRLVVSWTRRNKLTWNSYQSTMEKKCSKESSAKSRLHCLGLNRDTSNGSWCMGIKSEMSGTVCVTFTWDMYIYIYIYIWVVYSFCLFCCLFIIVTWWYVWCIVWASDRVGGNSIPELQLNSNSNSGIGIGIEIGGIENGIGIEDSGIGIENRNWIFLQLLPQHLLVNQQFPNSSFNS